MKSRRARSTKRGPEYHVTVSFQAPLDFVFAWCTDYTPEDASLEDESYTRKVIERTPRRVVFEDLEETDTGWDWSRAVVSLRPPSRWHMDGVGNRVDVVADYLLTKLPDGRTRLDLTWKRQPRMAGLKQKTKAEREASATHAWKLFAAALERDYDQSRGH